VEGDPQALMHPLPADRFRVWPVTRAVNSVRNDGPELLEPHVPADTAPALL
jgi:putative SOS response-associated peptidase YedK